MTPTQDDVDRWAKLIASAYASDRVPLMTPIDVLNLATYLGGPLADCLMLALLWRFAERDSAFADSTPSCAGVEGSRWTRIRTGGLTWTAGWSRFWQG